MSREVRRVPINFKHPTEYNPRWPSHNQGHPASLMHVPQDCFVALLADYPGTLAAWEQDLANLKARAGFDWEFAVEYYLTGYKGHRDTEPTVHPYVTDDEETIILRDIDHLHELIVDAKEAEKPDPDRFMPMFDEPEDELGWCLYQTVSEGSPVTPVFATAEELIEHLATVGQDYDQIPMRRASAEIIVNQGGTAGSMLVMSGHVYRSDVDADLIAKLA